MGPTPRLSARLGVGWGGGGRFAFFREWADVDLLQERGYFGLALYIQGEHLFKCVTRCYRACTLKTRR